MFMLTARKMALVAVAAVASLGLIRPSQAHAGNESNRNEVRARVEAGGWNVVWSVTINEAEYAKAAASLYSGKFWAYFSDYLDRNIEKFQRNAPGVTRQALLNTLEKAFRDRGRTFRIGRIGVKAGIATYQRWYTQSIRVPDGTERYKIHGPFNTWTWGYRPKFKTVTKSIPLPNHHQPYVGFRLY